MPWSEALHSYRRRGWVLFDADPAMERWASACRPLAEAVMRDPARADQWRCDGTWFAGVNVLMNDADGAMPRHGLPALSGRAVDFVGEALGFGELVWDRAQISIVMPGYPRRGEEETEAAARYRRNRCAAHVDGLVRSMPERRRRIAETHGFLLGIPLDHARDGGLVVWEGSHEVMRAAFREALRGVPGAEWRDRDVTDAYVAARRICFERCRTAVLAPGPGAAYVVHPLALHGVAPWASEAAEPRTVAYFRPDTLGGDIARWLAA